MLVFHYLLTNIVQGVHALYSQIIVIIYSFDTHDIYYKELGFFFSRILLSFSEYSNKIIIVISLDDKLWDFHEYGELNKAQGIGVSYSPHCLPILCLKIHKY